MKRVVMACFSMRWICAAGDIDDGEGEVVRGVVVVVVIVEEGALVVVVMLLSQVSERLKLFANGKIQKSISWKVGSKPLVLLKGV